MKNSDEMINELYERRDIYVREQKLRRRKLLNTSIGGLGICLVAAIGFGTWKMGLIKNIASSPAMEEYASLPSEDYSTEDLTKESVEYTFQTDDMVIPETAIEKGTDTAVHDNELTTDSEGFVLWNEKNVTYRLYQTLEKGGEETLKLCVRVFLGWDFYIGNNFEYCGKTLEEYYLAAGEENMLPEKLMQLVKEGDALKYGAALYETGTPEGEKWYKSLYDERVAFYGQALLDKYIVNGEFLKEQALADAKESVGKTTANEEYRTAENAYLQYLVSEFPNGLGATYDSERRVINFEITPDAFKTFSWNFGKDCIYDFAEGPAYDDMIGIVE